jgi:hexosaminidase
MTAASWLASAFIITSATTVYSFITWIEPRLPLPGDRPPPGAPWPLPKEWTNSSRFMTLSTDFSFSTNLVGCDVIEQARERYRKLLFLNDVKRGTIEGVSPITSAVITVKSGKCDQYPTIDSDESYSIDVERDAVQLKAETVWGALRAVETFSQLLWEDSGYSHLINETTIRDSPRFNHRGLLLDTARHFVPVNVIKSNLDAMSYNKFNVFHWHLSDDQSFTFESKVYPNITQLGTYHPKLFYSQAQIGDIIEHARLRGIRVIPEIDSPGHTYALGKAFPEILSSCYGDGVTPDTPRYPDFSAREILDPMNPRAYEVMKNIFSELKTVFKDEYIHLGMDEVYYECWKSSPVVKKFMEENNYTEVSQFEQHYVSKTLQNVADIGYKYLIWQDPIENGVKAANDTVVQIWKDKELDSKMDLWREYIVPIARQGYKMLVSSCWYLNYISYGEDWKKYYECDPQDFPGTESEKNQVIGGEAAMWGEYVDGTNILARLWPRASAVAERLWSPSTVNDTASAAFRLDQQRCRMVRRGIPAQPILNGFCGDYEYGL